MSYTQFETGVFLALVQASNAEGAQGHAEGLAAARSVAPDAPEHLARSALESFAAQGLLIIGSKYLDGRTSVRITGQGYQAAERIRGQIAAQLAEAQAPPRKIGF